MALSFIGPKQLNISSAQIEHSLSALLGQPDEIGDHGHRKVIRQVGCRVEGALRDKFLHHRLGLRPDLIADRP